MLQDGPYLFDSDSRLISMFHEHFPLMDELTLRVGGEIYEPLPPPFGFMLECMTSGNHAPICFVLPNKKNVAAILSIVIALSEIKNRFSEWVSNYARQIEPGTRVCVLPHRDVFEYGGVWKDMPGLFQLRVLGSKKDSRSFPEREVLRLEKTDKARPKGQLDKAFPEVVSEVPLDQLLKINSFGNKSVFECTTLVFASQLEFFDFVGNIQVCREAVTAKLSNCLTIGTFNSTSELVCAGSGTDVLFPMIGVTSRPVHLSRYARETPEFSRFFIVDGADRLVRNIQTFDQTASRQKLIVVASSEEFESIRELQAHGCVVWELGVEELALGGARTFLPELGVLVNSIRTEGETIVIDNAELDEAADLLDRLQDRLLVREEGDEFNERMQDCFNFLLELSAICTPSVDYDPLKQKLERIRADISRSRVYIAEEVVTNLLKCASIFESNIEKHTMGVCAKAEWIREVLSKSNPSDFIVVVRTSDAAAQIENWLRKEFLGAGVVTYGDVQNLSSKKRLIIPGWPGRKQWKRICENKNFVDVTFGGYSFEVDWLTAYQTRLASVLNALLISKEEKLALMELEKDACSMPDVLEYPRFILKTTRMTKRRIPVFDTVETNAEARPRKDRIDIIDSADGREGRYVSFVGEGYAYITDGCRLPLLNELTEGGRGRVKIIAGSELAIGDIVLFREVGDSDAIQLIARQMIGDSEYQRLRQTAGLWRAPLQRIRADTFMIEKWLREVGLRRTAQTINLWLNDPDVIGPTSSEDIEKIAQMTKDPLLAERTSEVTAAIKQVRSLHQRAGRALTDLILQELPKEIDREVKVSLEFGEAFIVEVESIESEARSYPALQVNKLRMRA